MPSIGIADKTTLDAVNTKVGTNADAAGTSTLFARLAQIAGYTDTLETLIGTASPTSGDLTTVFKGLKLIADYVDELESRLTAARAGYLDYLNNLNTRLTDTRAGKLDLVGTTGDAAGTGSIFARLAQIAGYTDTVETALGQTGDAANATGSANAKLAYLINNVGPTTPQIADLYVASATSNTYYTACNISGRGLLSRVVINAGALNSDKVAIQVTIDGGTPIVFSWTNAVPSRYNFAGKGAQIHFPNTLFKSSLKVEGKHTYPSASDLEVSVDYGLF